MSDTKKYAKTYKSKKKYVKAYRDKNYPKSGQELGCGSGGLATKICRRNVSRTNKMRKPFSKSKKVFIKDFKKSIDFRDTFVSIDSADQQLAELTASSKLIKYLRAGIDSDLSKIPFDNGVLTLYARERGLYSGFFQDTDGQIIEKFNDKTVELVAKTLQLRELYVEPAIEEKQEVENYSPHIKIKYGDFELEIKKSVKDFADGFKKSKDASDIIQKAIESWRSGIKNIARFRNDYEAAKELLSNWDSHKERFYQTVHGLQKINDED